MFDSHPRNFHKSFIKIFIKSTHYGLLAFHAVLKCLQKSLAICHILIYYTGMTEFIKNLVYNVFGGNVWLGVICIAIIPIIELRGAIPFALSAEIWGSNALDIYQAFFFSYIGSIIPAFLIILFLTPVFKWMKKIKFLKAIANFFEERFKRLGEKINKKSKNAQLGGGEELTEEQRAQKELMQKRKTARNKFIGVLLFAAIPLPLTGVWTSSAIAVFLDMKITHALSAVLIGNFICGIFISILCVIFNNDPLVVFYFIAGIFLFVFIAMLAMTLITKARKKNKNG